MSGPVVIDLPASPRARGEAHGEQLRATIAAGVARWKDSIAEIEAVHPDDWIRRFLAETDFRPAIEAHAPSLLEEVRGLAAGAGVEENLMFAYQLVDEQWCSVARRRAEHEHCSTLGIEGDPTIVAQNLDLPLWWDGLQTVLRYPAFEDEPGCIIVTAAGFIVMNGMNEAGVGVGVNALPDLPSAPRGLPVAFAIRQALTQRTASRALRFLSDVSHASGQNYIVGDRHGVMGVECDARGSTVYRVKKGVALHTNHTTARTGVADEAMLAGGALANSCARLDFLTEQRGWLHDAESAIELLSETTVPIRRVPTDVSPSSTFATVVFELSEEPVARVRGGVDQTHFVSVEPLPVSLGAR